MEPPQLLAATLIANRKRRGLSQEELAEAAGLSLRTVQRLEKGESLPRGFTLQALAAALELPVEALTSIAAAAAPLPALPTAVPEPILPKPTPSAPMLPAAVVPDDGTPAYVALMYLSAFSYILLPGANIVLPLLLRYRKRQVPEIQEAGSRLLNFELVWTLVTYGGYGLLLATQIILIMYFHIVVVLAPLVFLFSLNLLHAPLLLLGAWRARQGRYTGYPVGLRLF